MFQVELICNLDAFLKPSKTYRKTIELPFPPFAGLAINIWPTFLTIDHVTYHLAEQKFTAFLKNTLVKADTLEKAGFVTND